MRKSVKKLRSANVLTDLWLPVSFFKLINCGITLCLVSPFLTGRLNNLLSRNMQTKCFFLGICLIANVLANFYFHASSFVLMLLLKSFISVFQNSLPYFLLQIVRKRVHKLLRRKNSTYKLDKNLANMWILWKNSQKTTLFNELTNFTKKKVLIEIC